MQKHSYWLLHYESQKTKEHLGIFNLLFDPRPWFKATLWVVLVSNEGKVAPLVLHL